MASEWKTYHMGDAPLEIIDGDRGKNYPGQGEFMPTGHCLFLNAGNVTSLGFDFSNSAFISQERDALLRKGKLLREDLVLTTRGTVGNVAFFARSVPHQHLRINSGMVIIRPLSNELDPRFLYLQMRSEVFQGQLKALSTGSAQPQLPIRDMNKIEIVVPPLDDQRLIVSVLGALDDRIELLKELNQNLEAIARAIFKSWFVDFDPVRAKAEGREPEGMDAATAALFPSELEESAPEQIPTGWSFQRLSEFMEVNPLRSLPKGVAAPHLEMSNAPTSGPRPAGWAERLPISGCRFRNGDTLLAKITPCLENGKTSFVDFLDEGQIGWGSTEFIVLRPKNPIPLVFGYLLARDKDFRTFAIQSMSGTSGRQRVQVDQLVKFRFPIATMDIYRAFAEIVEPLFAAICQSDIIAKTLSELRDTLLPRLISGKLRVPEAEAMLSEVL